MRSLRLLALVAALASLTGCAALMNLLRGGIRAPTATFEHADLQDAGLDSVTVAATFRLTNPNPLGLSLAGVGYGFSLDGKKLFDGNITSGVSLPAEGASTLVVPVRIAYTAIPDLATTMRTKDSAPYTVEASASVQTPIGLLTVPMTWSGTLPIPKLPRIDVRSVRVVSLNFTGARLDVRLAVENPNGFSLPLTGLDGSVQVAGQNVASLALKGQRPLDAKRTTEISLPVDVSFQRAGLAASGALARHGAPVRLSGHATVGGRALPIDLATALP